MTEPAPYFGLHQPATAVERKTMGDNVHRARAWGVVAAFALLGLAVGIALGLWVSGGPERYRAQTTLAMLPGPQVGADGLSAFWEVLNGGQPTRTGAVVLSQASWLPQAAAVAGVPRSDLALNAGALPATSLIEITMDANSPRAAEVALQTVLDVASTRAGSASGPFVLQALSPVGGSARLLSPPHTQTIGTFGLAGLLVGAGAGALVAVQVRRRLGAGRGSKGVAAGVAAHEGDQVDGAAAGNASADARDAGVHRSPAARSGTRNGHT